MTQSDRALDFAITRVTDSFLKPASIEALQKLREKKIDDAAIYLSDALLRMLAVNPEFFLLLAIPPQKSPDRIVSSILARFWIDFLKPLQEELKDKEGEETYEKTLQALKEKVFINLKAFLKSSTSENSSDHLHDEWESPLTAVLDHSDDRYEEPEFDRTAHFVINRLFDYQGLFPKK